MNGSDFSKSVVFVPAGSPGLPAVVVFGGVGHQVDIPILEFSHVLEDIQADKFFINDFSNAWYHLGLDGISATLSETATFLHKTVVSRYSRTILVGHSMGGYAALAFGALTDASRVVAFSPQAFISRKRRKEFADIRWEPKLDALYGTGVPVMDLEEIFGGLAKPPCTIFDIYIAANEPVDKHHYNEIKRIASLYPLRFNIHDTQNAIHHTVRKLREDNRLKKILMEAINEV
jgi:pimeloyl-ACP methyl ester carboxylesterase